MELLWAVSSCLGSGISDLRGDSELSLLSSVTGSVEPLVLMGEREDEAVAAIVVV